MIESLVFNSHGAKRSFIIELKEGDNFSTLLANSELKEAFVWLERARGNVRVSVRYTDGIRFDTVHLVPDSVFISFNRFTYWLCNQLLKPITSKDDEGLRFTIKE